MAAVALAVAARTGRPPTDEAVRIGAKKKKHWGKKKTFYLRQNA